MLRLQGSQLWPTVSACLWAARAEHSVRLLSDARCQWRDAGCSSSWGGEQRKSQVEQSTSLPSRLSRPLPNKPCLDRLWQWRWVIHTRTHTHGGTCFQSSESVFSAIFTMLAQSQAVKGGFIRRTCLSVYLFLFFSYNFSSNTRSFF